MYVYLKRFLFEEETQRNADKLKLTTIVENFFRPEQSPQLKALCCYALSARLG